MKVKAETYIGRPCKQGHTLRYVTSKGCVECRRTEGKAWAIANMEHVRTARREWVAANKEHMAAYAREYNVTNKDRKDLTRRKYYEAHKDRLDEYKHLWAMDNKKRLTVYKQDWYQSNKARLNIKSRVWAMENRASASACVARWRKNHPELSRSYTLARRAMKLGAPGSYDDTDIVALFTKQNGRCQYCCNMLGSKFDVDHVVPLSRGGSNYQSNLCLACRHCNTAKSVHSAETHAIRILMRA